jgi:PAS domain S-box-containing protein
MSRSLRWYGQALLFLVALIASAFAREGHTTAVTEAIIWLPTGVAIAGLWQLGLGAWWVVALGTVIQRVLIDYPVSIVFSAAIGSTAEAVVGVLVLRRLGFRGDFSRLRDVLALFAIAALAPLASILFSWLGRLGFETFHGYPFYSGWDGWWRMNALGALIAVPLILTWLPLPRGRLRARTVTEAGVMVTAMLVLLWGIMTRVPPGPEAIILLYTVLPIALFAAVRFGARGAASVATLGALTVSLAAEFGIGPFLSVPLAERHVAIQVFEVTLVAVPLVFGALIAEREASIALRSQSEAMGAAFQQILPDITYRIRADGTYLDAYVPPGAFTTVPVSELLGRKVSDVVPQAGAAMLERIAAAVRGEPPVPVEYAMPWQGQFRVREARYVRLNDHEVLGLVRDITERKRTEALLEWQAQVLELIATSHTTQEIIDPLVRGIESFCPGGICSVLLLDGKRVHVAAAPNLPPAYNAAIEGLEIGPSRGSCGTAAYRNQTVIVADITTNPLWADFRELAMQHHLRACWSVPIRSPAGDVVGTFAVYYHDARSPAPEELRLVERAAALAGIAIERERREGLLASINRNVNEGLYRSTPDRGLIYVNQAFARMFGYSSPEEMLQVPSAVLYEDPERREELKRVIAERGYFDNEEVRFRRRDGSVFWGLTASTGVRGPDGDIQFYDGAVADITVRKGLEEQLRQAQKMEAVGKLAGGIAHDFNNLLTAISGYAESVREAVANDERVRADVNEVLHAADRAAALTRQLLAYSRQQVLTPQVLDLTAVVEQLGGMLRRLIGEDVRLVIRHAAHGAHARVDRSQIEQVILNLVVNARDAMPRGGTLTIATRAVTIDDGLDRERLDLEPGSYVALSVQDTGVGMDAEVRRRAFDPFFTTKEPGKGTGLGLSTVYGIVRQSGGSTELESVPHAGTTVRVYLPRVTAPPGPTAEAVAVPVVAGSVGTILVVEDEQLVRNLVSRTLKRAGYSVLVAEDGLDALTVARRHTGMIDLMVTDVIMPRMGGRELSERLLRERPGLRVLFVSGYANELLDIAGSLGPGTEYLQKPFTPSVLLARVRELVSVERARS